MPVRDMPAEHVSDHQEAEEPEDVGLSRADEMAVFLSPRKVAFRGVEENSRPLEDLDGEPLDTC